jgi:uncharacterized OB-fold protein
MTERLLPAPSVSVEGKDFWAAAAQGRLLLKGCGHCGRVHWYPRAICPFCFADANLWRPTSGKGTIYSYSILRQGSQSYVIAYVTLAEGPTLLTNISDTALGDIAIGKAVELMFVPTEGGPPVPVFKVVDAGVGSISNSPR